ncbi:hypothetical protein L1887_30251 [Cichorium endivia]|nr:hypothetical protein L1887_30251 [Cichorium endivia]
MGTVNLAPPQALTVIVTSIRPQLHSTALKDTYSPSIIKDTEHPSTIIFLQNKWDTHPRVAVVREAAKRKLVLNDASIAEMKVGEGKTLAAYLNDLTREGVHVYSIFNYAWNLVFDYLRDNLAGSSGNLLSDVDEVDSILIDEGRNPLLISGEASKHAARYPVAAKVADQWFAVDH